MNMSQMLEEVLCWNLNFNEKDSQHSTHSAALKGRYKNLLSVCCSFVDNLSECSQAKNTEHWEGGQPKVGFIIVCCD